jgi:hypothetical protein
MKPSFITAAVVAACLASAAPANAGVRYASPTGMGSGGCGNSDPCSLAAAVASAGGNDDVALYPGTYAVNARLNVTNGVHLHGIYGQARPYITGDARLVGAVVNLAPGTRASYLGIAAQGPNSQAIELDGAIGRDLALWATSGATTGATVKAHPSGTLLVDAMAWTDAADGEAVHVKDTNGTPGGSATVLAVTAIGTGGAAGITTKAVVGSQQITDTVTCGSSDIASKAGTAPVLVDHSNFRAGRSNGVTDQGGNQQGLPIFRDEPTGDFRPVTGSPTIDAGIVDGRSTVDPWGVNRGSTPDIGAFEHVPGADPAGAGSSNACADKPVDPPTGTPPVTPQPPTTGDSTPPPPNPGPTTFESSALPPASQPVLGATVTLGDVKGAPLVRLPGSDRFVPLSTESTVPVGATVDASRGTVELTSVRDSSGKTQSGTFWGGVFKVNQSRKDSVTELSLAGGDFSDCRSKRRGKVTAAGVKRKRRLWGRDRGGRFRTRGRHGSATVRGTRWLTEDRCDGTYFKVTQGAIDVRDERKRKTVRLKRGGSYLAAATAKRKRTR